MHVILDMSASSPECFGKLWLGGEHASGDVHMLQSHCITIVLPASRKPAPAESLNIKVLDYVDGTALAAGDVRLEDFLAVADKVIDYLQKGHGILVCCKNGAHRSATLTVLLVMRLTGWDAMRAFNYVSQLRNIVDLTSVAPPSAHRRHQPRPIEFLQSQEDRIIANAFDLAGNLVVTPISYRKKAAELGFETIGSRAKSMPGPKKVPGQCSGWSSYEMVEPGHSTVSSHEMSSLSQSESQDTSSGSIKRARLTSKGVADFFVVSDDLKTPAARAQKLKDLCSELEALDAKLLSAVTSGQTCPKKPEPEPHSSAAAQPATQEPAEAEPNEAMPQRPHEEGSEATEPAAQGLSAEVKAEPQDRALTAQNRAAAFTCYTGNHRSGAFAYMVRELMGILHLLSTDL